MLQNVTHEDLTDIIIPSIAKSLLRNPEGVLEGMLFTCYIHVCICVCTYGVLNLRQR